jgi:hypothetical protein
MIVETDACVRHSANSQSAAATIEGVAPTFSEQLLRD